MKDYKRIILCSDHFDVENTVAADLVFNIQTDFKQGEQYLVSSRFIMLKGTADSTDQFVQVCCDSIIPIGCYNSQGRQDILGYYKNTQLDTRAQDSGPIFAESFKPFLAYVNSKSWRIQILNLDGAPLNGINEWRLEISLENVDCDCEH